MKLTRTRRLAVCGAAAAVALAVLAGTAGASPAHAGVTLLVCAGTETATFSPPLTNTMQLTNVSVTEDVSLCLLGGVTSGTASAAFQVPASCTGETFGPVTLTYDWAGGQTSTVDYTTASITRLADGSDLAVGVGTVTAGLDQGAVAQDEIIEPALNPLACAGAGVPGVSGPETLTFTGL
jgi:hypothetical protein